jgi:hypothetical protein
MWWVVCTRGLSCTRPSVRLFQVPTFARMSSYSQWTARIVQFSCASSCVQHEEQLRGSTLRILWWVWIIACDMAVLTTPKVGRTADVFSLKWNFRLVGWLGGWLVGGGGGDVTLGHHRPRCWKKSYMINRDMMLCCSRQVPSRGLKGGDFDILHQEINISRHAAQCAFF